jgi:hypothetical protein
MDGAPYINRQLVEVQKELLSASFSQAQAYTNIVLGAGYAGFFAVWAFTRDYLSDLQVLWSALLMSFSLIAFVAFEVYKSFFTSRTLLGLAETVQDESKFVERLAEWKREMHHRQLEFGRIWATTFWFAVVTGFGGGLVLLYAFLRQLLERYTS